MSEAQLNILNYALLALLYLFFGRVLWAVWSEVRGPRPGRPQPEAMAHAGAGVGADATVPARSPSVKQTRHRTKQGVPSRLAVLEPRVRKGSAYPIGDDIVLGRADSCAIGLGDDTFASQLHARVFRHDGKVWVEDLGSTNGTHLNGERVVSTTSMGVGDRLQVGNTIFEAR